MFKRTKPQKNILLIVITAIVIIVFIIVFIAIIKPGERSKSPLPSAQKQQQQPTKQQPALPQQSKEIDTSDWLTYRSEEYGFEVKYPFDWAASTAQNPGGLYREFVEFGPAESIQSGGVVAVAVCNQTQAEYLENIAREFDKIEEKDAALGGLMATHYVLIREMPWVSVKNVIVAEKNSLLYKISDSSIEDVSLKDIFHQIHTSSKFID